jgi:hypothetical protein
MPSSIVAFASSYRLPSLPLFVLAFVCSCRCSLLLLFVLAVILSAAAKDPEELPHPIPLNPFGHQPFRPQSIVVTASNQTKSSKPRSPPQTRRSAPFTLAIKL